MSALLRASVFRMRRRGCAVVLTVGRYRMVAEVRAGNLAAPARASVANPGLVGPADPQAHAHRLAKCVVDEAVNRAVGVSRRSEFDALVDDMHAARLRRASKRWPIIVAVARR